MSSNTPTSFASAAAGQSRGSRSIESDLSRREGRSANATMTFRRPSAANTSQHQPSATPEATLSTLPPMIESQNVRSSPPSFDGSMRYTREELLEIFNATSTDSMDVSNLYVSGWNSVQANGAQRGWGKTPDTVVPQDPTVCWDANGSIKPFYTQDLTREEKEFFIDVNSTLKPQQPKDNNHGISGGNISSASGRKTSVSHGSGYNGSGNNIINNTPTSTSSSRPATRRRETTETNPFSSNVTSPLASRPPRDDSSWFGRKTADSKESQQMAEKVEELEDDPNLTPAKPSTLATLGQGNAVVGSVIGGNSSTLWLSSNQAQTPTVGAFGSFALPAGDIRFGSARGESRLAHLIPKHDNNESITPGLKTTNAGVIGASSSNSSNVTAPGPIATRDSWRLRHRTDTDPFGEDDELAVASQQSTNVFDTPIKNARGDFGISGLHIGSSLDEDVRSSPETNPFRSPPAERMGTASLEDDQTLHGNVPPVSNTGSGNVPDHPGSFGSIRGGLPSTAIDGSDRSQTSSVGTKGFPSLGNISGWVHPLTSSTPDRERAAFSGAFGNSLFSPGTSELQSPNFGSVAPGGGVFGPGNTGSLRATTSKLNSLFPTSMQPHAAVSQEQEGAAISGETIDLRQINPLGAIGREAIGSQSRDTDSGIRPSRGIFDDPLDLRIHTAGMYTAEQQSQPNILASAPSPLPPFEPSTRPTTETPPNAHRTMVMPDRMRWVYLDPQGQTQGPFTGLEMNDWYKANFFTPDLRVRKVEDSEFEPLGQLIRKIGNSREPFLVPAMGIPHGQPSLSGTLVHGNHGGVVPPLVGAFPSYGRTLTAEEQNNLERRKQEEQYVLARHREIAAVQHHPPFTGGRVGAVGVPGSALHHHSSAHSLQSQPSFGSMTSPLAAGPPPIPAHINATQGFFDHTALPQASQPPMNPGTEFLREEYKLQAILPNLNPGLNTMGSFPATQPSSHLVDPASLSHLPSADQLQEDPQGFSERLKEFKRLREQTDPAEPGAFQPERPITATSVSGKQKTNVSDIVSDVVSERQTQVVKAVSADAPSSSVSLSLTQQVQKTQEAAAAKRRGTQIDNTDPRGNTDPARPDLPMPFPPPQNALSGMPLAAPTAQRTRSTLPDQYAVSGSRSETPESNAAPAAQPPPLAPWAREPGSENHRGPSLKEIQESEAKKAAENEEIAAAARKVLVEQEAALQREREKAIAAAAPGLPTTSTWGSGTPVVSSGTPASPWTKTGNTKHSAGGSAVGGSVPAPTDKKKTLAEIQREEEASKQKTRELSSQSPLATSHSGGKRYADLAGRSHAPTVTNAVSNVTSAGTSSGWATVGAGGKIKTPTGPTPNRVVSNASASVKLTASSQPNVRSGSRQMPAVINKTNSSIAMEEFNKWVHREVSRGVSDDIDVNVFVDSLRQLPPDATIIAEAVYGNSKTMDGRHFADEFIRRKKLAEKGIIESQTTITLSSDDKTGGGWSEVAKKGNNSGGGHQKEESMTPGFKVVSGRKKGRK